MQAIVLEGLCQAIVRELPDPEPARDEVVVHIARAGICGSDVAVFTGERQVEYPLVMGHEAVGYVVNPGDSSYASETRVVIEPNLPCGVCRVCRRGHANVCPSKRSLGMNWPGAFAEQVSVPAEYVHALPADLDYEEAVGIEPLAVALHALRVSEVTEGDHVAVIGCGAEGLLLVQALVASGARVLVADLREERLAAARALGAERTLLVGPNERPGEEADFCAPIVFESAGAAKALELSLASAEPGGRVVALGLGADAAKLVPLSFVRRGLTLIGSLIYDHPLDFQHAIHMVSEGKIRPSTLVSQTVTGLESVPAALQALATSDAGGKVMVNLDSQR